LDRFGRVWYARQRMPPDAVAHALRERRSADPDVEVEILCDPFVLPMDQQRLIDRCRESGVPRERIHSRRADPKLCLDELTIPAHDGAVQRLVIATTLSREVAPWQPIRRYHENVLGQVRQALQDYWNQLERFREQVNTWHHEYQGLTTRKSDAAEP